MSRDTLSDVLRAVRLHGALFYYIEGASPWVAEAPPAREIIPAIMPGVDHMIEFHGLVEGSCWAAITGEPPIRLAAGDLVLFPQGDAHVMSSAPGLRAPSIDKGFFFAPRPPQLPYALSMTGAEITTARLDGGSQDRSTVVCGFLGLDARPFNPLLAALPRVLHVPASALGEANRRLADDRAPTRSLDDAVVLDHVLGAGHDPGNDLPSGGRLRHPGGATVDVIEDGTPQPDCTEHIGQRVLTHPPPPDERSSVSDTRSYVNAAASASCGHGNAASHVHPGEQRTRRKP